MKLMPVAFDVQETFKFIVAIYCICSHCVSFNEKYIFKKMSET